MRRRITLLLCVLNAMLAGVLLWLWVTPQGKLRTAWQTPSEIAPAIAIPGVAPAGSGSRGYVAALERPLFSPSRLPPPSTATGAAPVQSDALANVQLYAVYAGRGIGGIIARVDGKPRRIRLNEAIGDWTVKQVKDRDVTLVRGAEIRVLQLATSGRPRSEAAAPTPAAVPEPKSQQIQPQTNISIKQQIEEEERARLARRNALRAKAGLPPVE